jgi:hypothetical protein
VNHFHHIMSLALIHIGHIFISWSNWHYKRVSDITVHHIDPKSPAGQQLQKEFNTILTEITRQVADKPKPTLH